MIYFAVTVYASACVFANLSVAFFGPWVSPINSFILIGLDLALRDWLHLRLKWTQMLLLICASGIITFVLNPSAGTIAVASASAFAASAIVDWTVFARLKGSWLRRSNGSNLAGAAVDSILFPTIAFGALMPGIIVMQFAAKVAGGALWSFAFNPTDTPPPPPQAQPYSPETAGARGRD